MPGALRADTFATMRRGKYRLRTAIRRRLPWALVNRDVAGKGWDDCGDHEWYAEVEGTWRCYHCMPGVTHKSPWADIEDDAT